MPVRDPKQARRLVLNRETLRSLNRSVQTGTIETSCGEACTCACETQLPVTA